MLNEYLTGEHGAEADPYYPMLVDDLLKGLNDWKNVQDIIRLTFKALSDVVRVQGEAIRDLEHGIQTRVSRSELTSALALKISATEVSRELNDLAVALESKPSLEDLRAVLDDKVSKSDLQYQLSSKVSIDEVKTLMDHKTNLKEFENEAEVMRYQLQQTQKDLVAKMQTLPSHKDLQLLRQALDGKANSSEMAEALDSKANKQAVANALQRKANKADVDAVLSRKPDLADFQEVVVALESKADITTVERLMQAIDGKVDRNDLDDILHEENSQRPGSTDLDSLASALVGLRKEVDFKLQETSKESQQRFANFSNAQKEDITSLHSEIESRLERINDDLMRKMDSDTVSDMFASLKRDHELALSAVEIDFHNELKRIGEAQTELTSRLDVETHRLAFEFEKTSEAIKAFEDSFRVELDESIKLVHSITASAKTELFEDLRTLKTHMDKSVSLIDELSKRKADRRDVNDLAKTIEGLSSAADTQGAIISLRKDFSKLSEDMLQTCKELILKEERDLVTLIEKKASMVEVRALIDEKADVTTVNRALGSRATMEQIQEFVVLTDQLSLELRRKANLSDFEAFGKYTRTTLEDLGKAVLMKANMADVLKLLDEKAPADSTHKILQQLLDELDHKAPAADTREFIAEQKQINQTLCAENFVGRWIWKSGEVRNGYAIPWEVQTVNTFPDNFLWDLDKTSILCVAPGLYEVSFGFYCRRPPVVQLLINGEPVFTVGGPKDQGQRQLLRHSAGNVAGLTGTDFVAVPARARVSFLFTGDPGGEGFLSLRKL